VPATRQRLGTIGERAAAGWLEAQGYHILARNVRTRHGEIDLIARLGPMVVFVEVKSRTGTGFGHPADAVVASKRRRLGRLAAMCLQRLGLEDCAVRFDVVAVHLDPAGGVREVEQIIDAFDAVI
jgi:putative endonuclease